MIDSLGLENIKAFAAQHLRLAPLTLLTGLNGMGKSTVLQALLLLRQSWQQKVLHFGLALNGDLVQIGTGTDARYELADSDEIVLTATTRDGFEASWAFIANPQEDLLPLVEFSGDEEIYGMSLFGTKFHYLNAERIGPRLTYPMSDYQARRLEEIGSRGELAPHYLQVFGGRPVAPAMYHPLTTTNTTLVEQVGAWLGEVSPGAHMRSYPMPGTGQIELRWAFDLAGHRTDEFRTTNVGFGLSYILPVLVALLSATPDHLILIENPEAHLHPRGQRLIGDLIARCANSGAQVVVETHSDHVLNGIRLATMERRIAAGDVQIHYVERQTGSDGLPFTVVHSPVMYDDGRLSDWPDGFFDEWEKALRLMLQPREGGQAGGA